MRGKRLGRAGAAEPARVGQSTTRRLDSPRRPSLGRLVWELRPLAWPARGLQTTAVGFVPRRIVGGLVWRSTSTSATGARRVAWCVASKARSRCGLVLAATSSSAAATGSTIALAKLRCRDGVLVRPPDRALGSRCDPSTPKRAGSRSGRRPVPTSMRSISGRGQRGVTLQEALLGTQGTASCIRATHMAERRVSCADRVRGHRL